MEILLPCFKSLSKTLNNRLIKYYFEHDSELLLLVLMRVLALITAAEKYLA